MEKIMVDSLEKEENLSWVHKTFISLIVFACSIGLLFGIYSIHKGITSSETTVTMSLEKFNDSMNSNAIYTFVESDNSILYRYIQIKNDKTNLAEIVEVQDAQSDIFYDLEENQIPYVEMDLIVKEVDLKGSEYLETIYNSIFESYTHKQLDNILGSKLDGKEVSRIKRITIYLNKN